MTTSMACLIVFIVVAMLALAIDWLQGVGR